MNVIFSYEDGLGAVSDALKASTHRHWMLQLFLSAEAFLDISMEGKSVNCAGIVVDMDTVHQFGTGGRVHFTMLINPVSRLGRQLHAHYINGRLFYVLPEDIVEELQNRLGGLTRHVAEDALGVFIAEIHRFFNAAAPAPQFDERVESVLKLVQECACEEKHRMENLAQAVHLSPSRLAHLFKSETRVPLKSYLVLHELQKAYAVLAEGGSVTDAAMAAGFDSPSHLAYTNRKMTGMSASGIIRDSEFLKVGLRPE